MEEALSLFPLGGHVLWALVWLSAGLTGLLVLAVRRNRLEAAGLAVMVVPLWLAFWAFLNSIPALQDPGTVLQPASPERLSRMYYRGILVNIGYLGAGFLIWAKGRTGRSLLSLRLRELAHEMRRAGVPMGGRSEAASIGAGYLLFPILLGATWLSQYVLTSTIPAVVSGDTSRVWHNMSPYHAVMISLAAGFKEELVYRGLLFVLLLAGLRRLLPRSHAAPVVLAIVGQALLFAAAHGGYGSWFNVLMPLLFGLVAGAVAWRWGVWAAIVLHVQIDLYIFGAQLDPATYPWAHGALLGLLMVNVAACAAWLAWRALRPVRRGPPAAG